MVFGIAFLLTGILIISLSFYVPESTPWYVPAIFGAVFLLLGIAMTFGRNGIVIDRRKRTMVHWLGLMIPMKKKSYPLGAYDHISISKDIHHGEGPNYFVYPVAIRSKLDTIAGLIFHEPADYVQARREAKKISAFLNLPIIDVSSGVEVVRKAGRLNETLREKEERSGGWMGASSPPPLLVSRIRETGEKIVIDIPPRRLSMREVKRIAFLIIMGTLSLFVVTGLENPTNMRIDQLIFYLPVGMAIILFAVRPVLYQAKKSWRITVGGESLTVEKLGPGHKNITMIPFDELEELLMGDPLSLGGDAGKISPGRKLLAQIIQGPDQKAITANSDKATVTFGHGVDEKELDYLHKLIRKRIIE